jgi:hypothetical protein
MPYQTQRCLGHAASLFLVAFFLILASSGIQCQLQQIFNALEVSGELPDAAQTIAGFTAHTLCEGIFREQEALRRYLGCLASMSHAAQSCCCCGLPVSLEDASQHFRSQK